MTSALNRSVSTFCSSSTPDLSGMFLVVIRDQRRSREERSRAFDGLLNSRGPWSEDGLPLIAFSVRCATTLIRKRAAKLVAQQLEPDVIATDALIDAWTHADRIPAVPSEFRGWVIGAIRVHVARATRCALRRAVTVALDQRIARSTPVRDSDVLDEAAPSELDAAINKVVEAAVDRLTPSLRVVARSRLFEGSAPASELSRRLGIRSGTVRQRWMRARRALQGMLLAQNEYPLMSGSITGSGLIVRRLRRIPTP